MSNPGSILEDWRASKTQWIVIDEIQKNPKLLDIVHKGIVENKIKFALTSSSARKLKKGAANMLAGRAASFQLYPFSAFELGEDFDLLRALKYGGLPAYWDKPRMSDRDCTRSLYSYVSTYLKEEVAAEQLVRNLDPFRRFLICAAQMNGKIVNYSKIERDAGIAPSQSTRHFEILADTLIGEYLEPYSQSVRKRQTQKSKFYFFDTGIVRALKNMVEEDLVPSTFEFGDLFETFIINEFTRLRSYHEKRWSYSYLRTKDDVEVDLIIEKPRGKPILVEIKSQSKITKEDFAAFLKISKEFPGSDKYVLSNTARSFEIEGIQCLHWQDGLKQIFE